MGKYRVDEKRGFFLWVKHVKHVPKDTREGTWLIWLTKIYTFFPTKIGQDLPSSSKFRSKFQVFFSKPGSKTTTKKQSEL